jgi:hypothetical protein
MEQNSSCRVNSSSRGLYIRTLYGTGKFIILSTVAQRWILLEPDESNAYSHTLCL